MLRSPLFPPTSQLSNPKYPQHPAFSAIPPPPMEDAVQGHRPRLEPWVLLSVPGPQHPALEETSGGGRVEVEEGMWEDIRLVWRGQENTPSTPSKN